MRKEKLSCLVMVLVFGIVAGAMGNGQIEATFVEPLAYEGSDNVFYGIGAGAATAGNDDQATFIGAHAGGSNTTGNSNTFIGYYAGYENTTGVYNTFVGREAGRNNTGSFNTFLGWLSGNDNTSGGFNVFLGAGAGRRNTTGTMNAFIGESAGGYNTEGNYNTFVGRQSGVHNTTGDGNTFVGKDAGFANTIGNYNTFIGNEAGYANTGFYNTFFGDSAGFSNTTAYSNTFIGREAGYRNTTGVYNTFVGREAGFNNVTGDYNTFLGRYAGYSATGSSNVFLGCWAGYNETGSNKLYIDSSDTSTPLIYGDFDTNRLTINGNLEVIGPDNGLVRLSNVTTNNTTKVSRMVLRHYSNANLPVYLFGAASTATDNFVAFGGGATIGNAATQLDFFTAANTTTPAGTARMTIKGNGYVGIGTQNPTQPLQMAGGAYTNGTGWFNASSREYKENIESLDSREALMTLVSLDPVKFNYKSDASEKHIGFIAEDVPELVAAKDRKGLSPMDIVAVLTKAVQEQQKVVQKQQESLKELKVENEGLKAKNESLENRLLAIERMVIAPR